MRVTVNLATRPFADIAPTLKRLRIGMGVLGVLAIGFGFGVHAFDSKAAKARASERELDAAIAKVNQEQAGYRAMLQMPADAEVVGQADAVNKLIDEKAFSWTLAMEDLETVLPGGVMVTTLEPTVDKKDGHITVKMRVSGARDKAVNLVANLELSHRFLQPRIVNEAVESSGNGVQQLLPVSLSSPVNFEILADYNPATADERRAARKKAQAEADKQKAQEARANPRPVPPGANRPGMQRPGLQRPGLQRAPYSGPIPGPPGTAVGQPHPQPGRPVPGGPK